MKQEKPRFMLADLSPCRASPGRWEPWWLVWWYVKTTLLIFLCTQTEMQTTSRRSSSVPSGSPFSSLSSSASSSPASVLAIPIMVLMPPSTGLARALGILADMEVGPVTLLRLTARCHPPPSRLPALPHLTQPEVGVQVSGRERGSVRLVRTSSRTATIPRNTTTIGSVSAGERTVGRVQASDGARTTPGPTTLITIVEKAAQD
jgi:hypothetical protein